MSRNVDREGPIQEAIVQFIRTQYPRALLFAVPNELASKLGFIKKFNEQDNCDHDADDTSRWPSLQSRIRNAQAKAKRRGMLAGAPDLVLLICGRFIALEVKAEGGRQQPSQMLVQAMTESNGGEYAVVRSVAEVQALLASPRNDYAELRAQIMPSAIGCKGENHHDA